MADRDPGSNGPAAKPTGGGRSRTASLRQRLEPWLRRGEQAVVATILAISLALILLYLAVNHYSRGGLIDIDHAEPWELSFQVDLNSADWPELALLPNVGEELARRIVEFRNERGPFRSQDDLLQVSGIGPKTLDGIRPYLLPLGHLDTISSE